MARHRHQAPSSLLRSIRSPLPRPRPLLLQSVIAAQSTPPPFRRRL